MSGVVEHIRVKLINNSYWRMARKLISVFEKKEWRLYIYTYVLLVSILVVMSYIFYSPSMSFSSTIIKTVLRVGIYMFIIVGIHKIILMIINS